jgi:hypothetical protein
MKVVVEVINIHFRDVKNSTLRDFSFLSLCQGFSKLTISKHNIK